MINIPNEIYAKRGNDKIFEKENKTNELYNRRMYAEYVKAAENAQIRASQLQQVKSPCIMINNLYI